jgi:hypothetical protein
MSDRLNYNTLAPATMKALGAFTSTFIARPTFPKI